MEEAKRAVVKHIVLAKFKEETTSDQIDEVVKAFANLVTLIEPMKSFQWGADRALRTFTHIFESTFESTEGVAEYIVHPAHVEFANFFRSHLEKVLLKL